MKKNIIFKYLVLITSTLIWNVRCGTVTTDKEEMTVKKGTTVSFTWTITPAAGESLAGLTISNGTYIEKDESNRLWKNTAPKIYPKTTEIFGDRFVVDDNIQGKLTVTIKSINYTEAMTLNLRVIFLDGLTASEALSNIQVIVQGGPELCGEDLNAEYTFEYQSSPSIDLCVSGNPRPKVEYTFDGTKREVTDLTVVDSNTHQYKYSMKLPQMKASHCGEELTYEISSSLQGSNKINGKTKIVLQEKGFPLDVTVTSFSYENNVPTVRWNTIESGKCVINYFLNITNATSIERYGPIVGTSLPVPGMREPTDVKILAQYGSTKGSISTFQFTKTTTTTTTTTTTPVPANKSSNTGDDDDNMGAIIGGAVGGVILVVLIIILVVCIIKKKNSDSTDRSKVKVKPRGGANENNAEHGSEMSLGAWSQDKSNNHYETVPNSTQPKEDPNQAIYSELGPGGRVGPKPTPAFSNYAEVLVDEDGFPITGETRETANPSLYDQVRRDSDEYDAGVIV